MTAERAATGTGKLGYRRGSQPSPHKEMGRLPAALAIAVLLCAPVASGDDEYEDDEDEFPGPQRIIAVNAGAAAARGPEP